MNIRSLRKNFPVFRQSQQYYDGVDVIVLTETFILDKYETYKIDGYEAVYNHAANNRNDGTIMYVKRSLDYSYKYETLPNSKTTILQLLVTENNVVYNICGLYRLQTVKGEKVPSKLFIEDLKQFVAQADKANINIFIGDININIYGDISADASRYKQMLENFGFQSYINQPTRITASTSTCIDHCFVNKNCNAIISSEVQEIYITDHYSQMISIDV